MRNVRKQSMQLSLLVAIASAPLPSTHAAYFTGLGDLPGGDFSSQALAISSDGKVVVGEGTTQFGDIKAFRWSIESGRMEDLGSLTFPSSTARGVSADGSVVVGWAENQIRSRAFRWTEATGMVAIETLPSQDPTDPLRGDCTDFGNHALNISDDGSTVVGWSLDHNLRPFGCVAQAFRFTEEEGAVGLGRGDREESRAAAVSADGTIVAGYSFNSATGFLDNGPYLPTWWLWNKETETQTDLGLPPTDRIVRVTDMTPDGSHVIGYSLYPFETFMWTAATGEVTPLAVPGPPYAMSDDGSVIVGQASSELHSTGNYVWTEATGARSLVDVLTDDFGLAESLQGWQLGAVKNSNGELIGRTPTVISGDGRAIAGTGINPDGNQEAWIATLEPDVLLQAGDADQDLDFDQLDLVQVQVAGKYLTGQDATWGEGDWNAAPEIQGDGVFDQNDIIAALQANIYLSGPYAAAADDTGLSDDLVVLNDDANIYKATFGGSYQPVSLSNVAPTNLSQAFLQNDLTVNGALVGEETIDNAPFGFIPVPEPTSILLMLIAYAGLASTKLNRRANPLSRYGY